MKKNILFATFTIIALFLLSRELPAGIPPGEELFFQAGQAYKEGRFQEAAEGYEQLIQSGYVGGHLHYNLGNCYFRLNRLGQAILNYERAYLFIPRDADLNFNLGYTRDQTRDAVSQSRSFINMTFFWLNSLNRNEIFWGFALLNGLFWLFLLVRLFSQSEWTYHAFLLLLIFWVIGGISFGLKMFQTKTDNRAIILKKEVNVQAGPDIHDIILFKIHEGTVLSHERSEDGWSLIRLPDQKRGWVKAEAIENINQSSPCPTFGP